MAARGENQQSDLESWRVKYLYRAELSPHFHGWQFHDLSPWEQLQVLSNFPACFWFPIASPAFLSAIINTYNKQTNSMKKKLINITS